MPGPKPGPHTKRVQVLLSPELWMALEQEAEREGVSVSHIIRTILAQHVHDGLDWRTISVPAQVGDSAWIGSAQAQVGVDQVFYCIHCLAYATRAEILKQQEGQNGE